MVWDCGSIFLFVEKNLTPRSGPCNQIRNLDVHIQLKALVASRTGSLPIRLILLSPFTSALHWLGLWLDVPNRLKIVLNTAVECCKGLLEKPYHLLTCCFGYLIPIYLTLIFPNYRAYRSTRGRTRSLRRKPTRVLLPVPKRPSSTFR